MPDNEDRNFPEEVPTSPDLASFPCPACKDSSGAPQGHILVTRDGETKAVPCDMCWGTKTVDRQRLALFKARGGT